MSRDENAVAILKGLFEAAASAVSADNRLPSHLPLPPIGKAVMIAVGKAAAAMAKVAIEHRPDIQTGLVVIPYGHNVPNITFPEGIKVIEARHPVPDDAGMMAAQMALDMVQDLGEGDQLLALISGGGSSLLALPTEGVSLSDKQELTRKLLVSGAMISEINIVRASLSKIKGGRLGYEALPADIFTLVISDVPGDDPAYVASGPTIMGRIKPEDAVPILKKYHLETFCSNEAGSFEHLSHRIPNETKVIATAEDALKAAVKASAELGYEVISLGGAIEGEAVKVANDHSKLIFDQAKSGRPTVILSGGETSVTMSSEVTGRGGRNGEYLLALAVALNGAEGIYAIACDTDGIDGSENNAGAIITPSTLARARDLGVEAEAYLENHDSYRFFETLGDLVMTGPTLTNVNDFRAILFLPEGRS